MRSRSGSRISTVRYDGSLDVALADLAAQIDEVVLLVALLDDEEHVDLVERADRLCGHVLGIAGADADQQQLPHACSHASAAGTSSTVGASGRGGRRMTITGSRRERAASSLASVSDPPLSFVTTRSMR